MRELGGLEFAEIGAALGTSAAVARQTLYEARLGLRQMDEGREMSCDSVSRALSDDDGRVTRRRDIRAHLRDCSSCRRFRDEIAGRELDLAALSPLPAAAAAGLLQGLVGGSGGAAGGGGIAAALGGGAANSAGAAAALKGIALVAAVGAIGVGVADRSGLIDVGLSGDGSAQATQTKHSVGVAADRGREAHRVSASVVARSEGSAEAGVGAGGRATAGPDAVVGASPTKADPRQAAGPDAGAASPDQAMANTLAGEAKTGAASEGPQGDAGGGGAPGSQGSTQAPPASESKGKGQGKEGKVQAKEEKSQAKEEKKEEKSQAKEERKEEKSQAKEEKSKGKELPSASEHGQSGKGSESGPPPSPPGATVENPQAPPASPAPPAAESSPGQGKGKKPKVSP